MPASSDPPLKHSKVGKGITTESTSNHTVKLWVGLLYCPVKYGQMVTSILRTIIKGETELVMQPNITGA